jgi:protein-S-isoprenylcysteine O-methyltransferase Ste14
MKRRHPSLAGLLVWWLGIGVVSSLIAAAFVDIAYSRLIYLAVVMPIGGLLLFPVAYAANRWLTPMIGRWLGRS